MIDTNLSAAERHVILHCLGLTRGGKEYRNYFCAEPGHSDWQTLERLVERGLMRRRHDPVCVGGWIFHVTDAGRAIAKASP